MESKGQVVQILKDRLAEIAVESQALAAEKEILSRGLELYLGDQLGEVGERVGPMEGILRTVRERPGMGFKELVEVVTPLVESRAKDPSHTVANTIYKLVADGKLIRRDNSLYLRGKAPMIHGGDREVPLGR